jgi:hypothetical protein
MLIRRHVRRDLLRGGGAFGAELVQLRGRAGADTAVQTGDPGCRGNRFRNRRRTGRARAAPGGRGDSRISDVPSQAQRARFGSSPRVPA